MSVGNSIIDDQHRYLLCLMNTIELAIRDKDNKDILQMFLDQLFEYTEYHFDHEERLQEKIKFPKAAEHKKEHQRILSDLKSIRSHFDKLLATNEPEDSVDLAAAEEITDEELNSLLEDEQTGEEEKDLAELTALVRHWVIDHVIGDDLKMKPYLSKLPQTFC